MGIPNFEESWNKDRKPGTKYFEIIAGVAELFFKSWLSWDDILENHVDRNAAGEIINCEEMLWISAARYIYYTHVLYTHNNQLTLCEEEGDKIIEPESVCYPEQSGSLTCTSDADVWLVGKDAGKLVAAFNEYFENNIACGNPCTSAILMDNNMYAFSLEFAVPQLFVPNLKGAQDNAKVLAKYKQITDKFDFMEVDGRWQWQDIAFALLQVKRSSKDYYQQYVDNIKVVMQKTPQQRIDVMNFDLAQQETNRIDIDDQKPTKTYSRIVKYINKEDFTIVGMNDVMRSHVYASEAYHSRGALRVVVITMQMKKKFMISILSLNDYWGGMLEKLGLCVKRLKKVREEHTGGVFI